MHIYAHVYIRSNSAHTQVYIRAKSAHAHIRTLIYKSKLSSYYIKICTIFFLIIGFKQKQLNRI